MKNILAIAGTDPSGGAGVPADLKSIAAMGGYGMAVITALVAQNTQGVRAIHTPPVTFLEEQLASVADDVRVDAVKIGMLGNVATIDTVAAWLERMQPPVIVLDPVMVATSGDRLLEKTAEDSLRQLLDRAHLVTPNLPELALLLGQSEAASWDEALAQGSELSARHHAGVIVKGGHLSGESCPDALVMPGIEPVVLTSPRIDTPNTHGTGCSLSSGMAAARARTGNWQAAFTEVKTWLADAIAHADDLDVGKGHGPINHFHQLYTQAGTFAGQS